MAALADSPIIYRFAGYACWIEKWSTHSSGSPNGSRSSGALWRWSVSGVSMWLTGRNKRKAGRSKYSVGRLWHLAMLGFTSFSTAPLYLILYLGVGLGGLALIGGIVLAVMYLLGFSLSYVPGLVACVVLLGAALQLVAAGVLGVYLSKSAPGSTRPSHLHHRAAWRPWCVTDPGGRVCDITIGLKRPTGGSVPRAVLRTLLVSVPIISERPSSRLDVVRAGTSSTLFGDFRRRVGLDSNRYALHHAREKVSPGDAIVAGDANRFRYSANHSIALPSLTFYTIAEFVT
jgi:hypothetical protein